MMKLRPTAPSGVAIAACHETDPCPVSDDPVKLKPHCVPIDEIVGFQGLLLVLFGKRSLDARCRDRVAPVLAVAMFPLFGDSKARPI